MSTPPAATAADATTEIPAGPTASPARWSVTGLLLEAIAARDPARIAACFEPDAVMRALLPRGPAVYSGVTEIVDAFRLWFVGAEEFEVLDGTVGDVGTRLHAWWRIRLHPTPKGDAGWHVIEQQVYAQAADRITAIDLLCSGFMPDTRG